MGNITTELEGGLAVVRLDDGKANALSPDVIEALQGAIDRAEADAQALLLVGRGGCFSGGFDLGTIRSGPEPAHDLVRSGAELLVRLYGLRLPVVAACTGHAIAAGALLLLSADLRIGARGSYRIGLSEVAISMTLPLFAIELARERISKRHLQRATSQAELYDPSRACDAGYLDRLAEPGELVALARAEAERLGALPQPAFGLSKARARSAALDEIRGKLAADLRGLLGSRPTA